MTAGQRIANRFSLRELIGSDRRIERWQAFDEQLAEPVDLITPRPPLLPTVIERFTEFHRTNLKKNEPAFVRTREILTDQGRVWVVREPLEARTFADLRGPLAPEAIAAIGAYLLPALLSETRQLTLFPHDILLDARGWPKFAPTGIIDDRLLTESSRYLPPEAFEGSNLSAATSLYSLGVILYRLLTDRDPIGGSHAPAPSAIRRGVPPALDQAIQRLLASEPNQRAGALPWLQEAAGPLPNLHESPRAMPALEPIIVTRSASVRRPTGPALWIPSGALVPEDRTRVAAILHIPEDELQSLIDAKIPLVLGYGISVRAELEAAVGRSIQVGSSYGCLPFIGMALSMGSLPLIFLLAWFVTPVVASLVAGGFALILLISAVLLIQRWSLRRSLQQASRRMEALKEDLAPELLALRERVSQSRKKLLASALPQLAMMDLRGTLLEIERRAEAVGQRLQKADQALRTLQPTALASRLATATRRSTVEAAAAEERDQLARALVDAEEVERRRHQLAAELRMISATLDQIDATTTGTAGELPEFSSTNLQAIQQALGKPSIKETQ